MDMMDMLFLVHTLSWVSLGSPGVEILPATCFGSQWAQVGLEISQMLRGRWEKRVHSAKFLGICCHF